MTPIILASTSPYRRDLLSRLHLPFDTASPHVDETPQPGESPDRLAMRLAQAKAAAVAGRFDGAVTIGSDQVAAVDDEILGKPGDAGRARAQLAKVSGRDVIFHTAVCVLAPDTTLTHVDETRVLFRRLDDAEIERYVSADQPYNCAGSFKAENLGIALFEQIETLDPTGLIGLPLIWLAGALRQLGYRVP